MTHCLFASDLHGQASRYRALFEAIGRIRPAGVFLGGDLLPHRLHREVPSAGVQGDFLEKVLRAGFRELRSRLGELYPRVFLILGNDDSRHEVPRIEAGEREGLWTYLHGKRDELAGFSLYGYAFVPPTPFHAKDWERYDVSRYVPPGAVAPEDGSGSQGGGAPHRYPTIRQDLADLAGEGPWDRSVWLFHSPPSETNLDRADLAGKSIDHVPLDLHVGSVAIRRFIETHAPRITLHGHVHESTRLTGSWRDRIGPTHLFGAAHDGPELALVRFDLEDPEAAQRELL